MPLNIAKHSRRVQFFFAIGVQGAQSP